MRKGCSDKVIIDCLRKGWTGMDIVRKYKVSHPRVRMVAFDNDLFEKYLENGYEAKRTRNGAKKDTAKAEKFIKLWKAGETAVEIAYQMGFSRVASVYGTAMRLRKQGYKIKHRAPWIPGGPAARRVRKKAA